MAVAEHLVGMNRPRTTCEECGGPIKQPEGRGRPRVYCGPACRNTAYEKRRGAKPRSAPPDRREQVDEGEITVGDVLVLPQFQSARAERLLWIDAILDSPTSTHDLMQELICRVGLGLVLEDMRYQPAVDQLVVAYRMIGRISNGNFKLPAVIA